MTALRWLQAHWLPVLVGAFLAAVIFQFLTRATPLQPAAAVGFMLSAILGGCLFVLFVGNAIRIDEVDERLASLEQHLAAEPEPEVGGWPEEEPNPVEPPDDVVTWESMTAAAPPVTHSDQSWSEALERSGDPISEPDDAKTDEIPVQPPTVPMERAWDVAVVELVIEEPAPEPAPIPDWQAEQAAWLKAERARLDEMAWEAT